MDSFNDVKKRQHQIHTFFQKKLKVESEKNSDVQVTQSYNDSNSKDLFTQSDVSVNDITIDCENIANNQCNTSNITSTSEGDVLVTMTGSDIGLIIGRPRHQINDTEKFEFLCNLSRPSPDYKYPASGSRNLKFQNKWFYNWKWLSYSKSLDGAFCVYCVLFGTDEVKYQKLGKLVCEKYNSWNCAVEKFNKHQNSVAVQLDTKFKLEIEENRLFIQPIIETILVCGRQQGLALRGHKDYGPIQFETPFPTENDGNFRALLRYRVNGGDQIFRQRLQNCPRNATYTSSGIQNQIIDIIGSIIIKKLVNKINQAKCFTVLADETCDISGIEQFSLCVRYYESDTGTNKMREDFLKFVPVIDVTGNGLAEVLIDSLKNIGLDLNFLRGQGYDGASAMRGHFNGVQAVVRRSYPLALYSHCSSHSLNLAISDACNIKSIRNATGTLQAIYVFFKTPKRQNVLRKIIDEIAPENKKKKLKDLCPTRWVERHESVMVFLELFDSVVEALEEISNWVDRETSSKSNNLLCSIKNGEFLLTVHILAKALSISLPLSRQLQTENLDLVKAMDLAEDVSQAVMELRKKAEAEFKEIYTEVNRKCETLGVAITIPRLTKNQKHKSNFTTNSSEEYFRLSIYIPFLDSFSNQLRERFLAHKSLVKNFSCLLSVQDDDEENFVELIKIYAEDIVVDEKSAKGEFLVWKQQIKKSTPKHVIDALHNYNSIIFPTIHRLLVILATFPVTTSTSERSFSTLRRLKTYLRNTVGENRLNGLALMNIHRDIPISTAEVIDELALQSRRLKFA
ncbi:zinc finger MYM-type protein 1-like [Acyrthosiphon pisum]|uniref:TTF-type domain-containing protein n=1 Tax=Acyrthosiphon pisum TaxID=7029 RepID=A0A8R2B7T9_ACYPI|nr:zinc finger MYM-type protein 1-like [Acyrthosiphon pisum]|eukprot:XP_008185846.1 PREDICTED: zinc finger MYM-type protein 1-like [Acyrthosiphon pisum]